MGLDMYLYQSVGVKADEIKGGEKIKALKKIAKRGEFGENHLGVRTEVAYWRKFNALHRYMREHFGGEEDNCQDMYLSIEDIVELRDLLVRLAKKMTLKGGWINWGATYTSGYLNQEVELTTGKKKQLKDLENGDTIVYSKGRSAEDAEKKISMNIVKNIRKNDKTVSYAIVEMRWGKVVANAEECEKIFPTEEGFFFGSTDYDFYYKEQVEDTIKQLSQVIEDYEELKKAGFTYVDYYYWANC